MSLTSAQYDCTGIDPCDNLTCFEDFESYAIGDFTDIHDDLGGDWVFTGYDNNFLEICGNGTNRYLLMDTDEFNSSQSGLAIPLLEPLPPGCELIIDYKVSRTSFFFETEGTIVFLGSETYPCLSDNTGVNFGCTTSDCGLRDYDPVCVSERTIPLPKGNTSPCSLSTGDFQTFQDAWVNTTNSTIHYLIIYNKNFHNTNWIALDDLIVTRDCGDDPDFTWTASGCHVEFESNTDNDGITHEWEFGNSMGTSAFANPGFTFPGSGTYIITHTIYTDCGTFEEEVEIEVECDEDRLCGCEDSDYNIGSTGVNTFISTLSWDQTLGTPEIIDVLNIPCINIAGNLIIDKRTNFVGVDNIFMENGAMIVVDVEDELFYNFGVHYRGCTNMWQGIHTFEESGIAFINSTIEDALRGIYNYDGSYYSGWGSIYANNYYGMLVKGSVNQGSGPAINIYTINDTYLPAATQSTSYSGVDNSAIVGESCGIYLGDVNSFNIGDVMTAENQFVNLENGILAYGSSFNLVNSDFVDMNASTVQEGVVLNGCPQVRMNGCNFEDCTKGITCTGSNIDVDNCTWSDVTDHGLTGKYGIRLTNMTISTATIVNSDFDLHSDHIQLINSNGMRNFTVTGNDMLVQNDGYQAIQISNAHMATPGTGYVFDNMIETMTESEAIQIGSSDGFAVYENIIESHTVPGEVSPIRINYFVNSDDLQIRDNTVTTYSNDNFYSAMEVIASENLEFCCNQLQNSGYGVVVQGMCGGTQLKTTQFDNHQTSLWYRSTGVTGDQEENGNNWANSPNLDGFHQGDHTLSEYIVHPSYMPNSIDPPTNWFYPNGINLYNCANWDCDIMAWERGATSIDSLDYHIAANDLNDLEYGEVVQWAGNRRLFRRVEDDPEMLDDIKIRRFHSRMLDTEVERLDYIDNSINGFYRQYPHSGNMSLLISQIGYLMDEMDSIRVILPDLAGSDSTSAVERIEVLRDEVSMKSSSFRTLRQEARNEELASLMVLHAENQALDTETEIGLTEKRVNDLYLSHLIEGRLTATEIDQLYQEARKCVDLFGYAVFMARDLYGALVSNPIDWEVLEDCTPQLRKAKNSEKNADGRMATVYPNPTTNHLLIEWQEDNEVDLIQVLDLNGKILYSLVEPSDSNSLKLSTSSWSDGIYLVKIVSNEGTTETHRIIVER